MKHLILVLTLLLTASAAVAQKAVERFEAQFTFLRPDGFDVDECSRKAHSIEVRYNLKDSKFDVGLMGQISNRRQMAGECLVGEYKYPYIDYSTMGLSVVSNYNFMQGRNINPYVGVGIGYLFCEDSHFVPKGTVDTSDCTLTEGSFYRPAFQLNAGVELLSSLRLVAQLNLCNKYFNTFSIGVGFVIGGRPKCN